MAREQRAREREAFRKLMELEGDEDAPDASAGEEPR